MRRLATAIAAAALLAVGTAVGAGATTLLDEQTPTQWVCPGFSGFNGAAGNYNPANNPIFKSVADKLGMAPDALANELKAGKSVADVAGEKKVDLQTLVDVITGPQKEMMAIRVKYGFLTQAQADDVLKNMAAAVKGQLSVKGAFGGAMMGGFGMMGGGFGPGGMMRGFGNNSGTATPGTGPGYGRGGMMRGFNGQYGPGMMGRSWQNRSN